MREVPTERETDVLRLLAAGQSNKEIAPNLGVNESPIESPVSSILSKLGVPGAHAGGAPCRADRAGPDLGVREGALGRCSYGLAQR